VVRMGRRVAATRPGDDHKWRGSGTPCLLRDLGSSFQRCTPHTAVPPEQDGAAHGAPHLLGWPRPGLQFRTSRPRPWPKPEPWPECAAIGAKARTASQVGGIADLCGHVAASAHRPPSQVPGAEHQRPAFSGAAAGRARGEAWPASRGYKWLRRGEAQRPGTWPLLAPLAPHSPLFIS
jgi:hypothetical protein